MNRIFCLEKLFFSHWAFTLRWLGYFLRRRRSSEIRPMQFCFGFVNSTSSKPHKWRGFADIKSPIHFHYGAFQLAQVLVTIFFNCRGFQKISLEGCGIFTCRRRFRQMFYASFSWCLPLQPPRRQQRPRCQPRCLLLPGSHKSIIFK